MAVQKADGLVTIEGKSFKIIDANVNNSIIGKMLKISNDATVIQRHSQKEKATNNVIDMLYGELSTEGSTADECMEKLNALFEKEDFLNNKISESLEKTCGAIDDVYKTIDLIIEKLLGVEALKATSTMNFLQKNEVIGDIMSNSRFIGKAVRKANVSK